MFTDRDAATEKSFATQDCSGADISSTAWSHDQLFPAGTLSAYVALDVFETVASV